MICPTKPSALVLSLVTAVALAATLTCQSASYATFGTSCRSDIALSAPQLPRLGQGFAVRYAGPYDPAFLGTRNFSYQPILMTGSSHTAFGATSLPFLLPAGITGGATTCNLYVAPDILMPLPIVPGSPPPYALNLTIPSAPALLGASFFQQWLLITTVFDLRTNLTTQSIATSNAAHGVIGV